MISQVLSQVDVTGLIQHLSGVRPTDGSAYGWLVGIVLLVCFGEAWMIVYLVKKVDKKEDEKTEFIEKNFEVTRSLTDAMAQNSRDMFEIKTILTQQSRRRT